MKNAIQNFAKQFTYEPVIENADALHGSATRYIVAGMGGSNLVADLLRIADPACAVASHRDYGLPHIREEDRPQTLIITTSYSGNTEETISSLEEAIEKKYPCAAIATGGKLLDIAKRHSIPYIQLPSDGIQPRMALGYVLLATLAIMGRNSLADKLRPLASSLDPAQYEERGKALAKILAGSVPIIYSSTHNKGLAYNWKIKLNETGKVPAFYNVLPELNHNEMTGFDVVKSTLDLSKNFCFVFLRDEESDHPRILKRMEVLERLYADRGFAVEIVSVAGKNIWEKIFVALLLADWTAVHLAEHYGVEAEQVPMVEEFKKLIA